MTQLAAGIAQHLLLLRRLRKQAAEDGSGPDGDGAHRKRARTHEPIELAPDLAGCLPDVLPHLADSLADLSRGAADGLTDGRCRFADLVADALAALVTVVRRRIGRRISSGDAVAIAVVALAVRPQHGESGAGDGCRNRVALDRFDHHV